MRVMEEQIQPFLKKIRENLPETFYADGWADIEYHQIKVVVWNEVNGKPTLEVKWIIDNINDLEEAVAIAQDSIAGIKRSSGKN